jgi:hypothetical protein
VKQTIEVRNKRRGDIDVGDNSLLGIIPKNVA